VLISSALSACIYDYPGANGIRIAAVARKFKAEAVGILLPGCFVAVYFCGRIEVADDEVQVAVVIQICISRPIGVRGLRKPPFFGFIGKRHTPLIGKSVVGQRC